MKKLKKFSDIKANDIVNLIILLGVPIVFVFSWQTLGGKGIINGSIMPAPSKIVDTFNQVIENGTLWKHFSASILRVLFGFTAGAAAGIIAGILTGLFEKINKAVAVIFGVLRPIPMIGLVPLFILWFGIGEESKIVLIAVGTFWSVLLNTEHGIQNVDYKFLEVARILEKNKLTTLIKIVFPASIPSIFTGLRLGLSAAWRCLVAAEMLASTKGVGYMISYARELAQPALMFVGLFTIGFVGIVIDVFIKKLQQKLIKWA
ncbi:MAG: ABC transporter permease [Ruminiclostridium sp.]